jgi:hypothetical protein
MSSHAKDVAAPDGIDAPIVYLVYTGETPVFYQSAADVGKTVLEGTREKKLMRVRNARLLPDTLSLDVEGFAFAKHATRVTDFWDDGQLAAIYTPEVAKLVAAHTGAAAVVVFDHTRRSTVLEHRDRRLARDPAGAAHTDYTDASARQRLRDAVTDPAEAEARLCKRFAVVNVWRSMTGPIEQWPLAVCDARSIDDDLLHTVERRDNARKEPSFEYSRPSETRHASYDARHRWYYFPRMARNEVVLLKNYDTLTDGTARYSLHSAIEDPTTPPDAAPRESIESRAFAFFD